MTRWSRLEGTPIWMAARGAYDRDAWRRYHTFGHPLEMYDDAANLGIPYHPQMDLAILTHDVIIADPHPEYASSEWLGEIADRMGLGDVEPARRMIMMTTDHVPRPFGNALIILDLFNLTCPSRRSASARMVIEEAIARGVDEMGARNGTASYLTRLSHMLNARVPFVTSPEERDILKMIEEGALSGASEILALRPRRNEEFDARIYDDRL